MPTSSVIGAGIVGLTTALYLQRCGRQVQLFDRQAPGEGTSSGNAGIISTGSIFPEAMPGVWREIPGMLLGKHAPVSIRPAYALQFSPWLIKFLASSRTSKVNKAVSALSTLSAPALQFYEPLLTEANAQDLIQRKGMFYVYETAKAFNKARSLCKYRDQHNSEYEVIEADELQTREPALRHGLAGAIVIPHAAFCTSPLSLCRKFFDLFQLQGGIFHQQDVKKFTTSDNKILRVIAEKEFETDEVFITAGAYSNSLVKQLGHKVPLDTERGYHLMLPSANVEIHNAMLFTERAFGVTPMQDGVRLAGTVEFGGLSALPDYSRAEVLGKMAQQLYPGLDMQGAKPWMGYRPSVPDSIPVISRSSKITNAFFGFGHGHLGLTQAAITGSLLATLACNQETDIDMTPYNIDRRW